MNMRTRILIFFAFVSFWGSVLPAQSEKLMPHGGFTYQFIILRDRFSGASAQAYYYGLSGGVDYVLMHSNDQVSLGVDPNVHFSFAFTNQGTSLLLQTPVYLLARVGAGCTPFNEAKVGVGAGVGGNFSYINEGNRLNRFSQTFFSPAAVGEFSLRTRAANYVLRVNFTPFQTTTDVDGADLYFNNIGASFLYTF